MRRIVIVYPQIGVAASGTAEQIRTQRQATLNQAYAEHPERFTRRPRPPKLPETAWINQPAVQPQPTS
jgi:putative transposase